MNPDGPGEVNPYEPPSADLNVGKEAPTSEGDLAERGTRFVAKMVDGLMALALMLPAIVPVMRSAASGAAGAPSAGGNLAFFRGFWASGLGMAAGVAYLALVGLQAYLIATTGQSIGKRWFKIKIVKLDGSRVSFGTGVLVRQWLISLLQYIPGIGSVTSLNDVLFIFRADRRCVHDFLAGTKVIQLKGAPSIRVA
jgi:uncharacterized RDD family membrane protein YckC